MRRIAEMDVTFDCWLFVFAEEEALPTSFLADAVPSCRIVRQRGFYLHHFFGVPDAAVARADYVAMLIDSVEMRLDVDLNMLIEIMRANGLESASPACSSCLTKRQINHDFASEVGRTEHVDPQLKLFTPAAYRCMRHVAVDLIGLDEDPTGWAVAALFIHKCRALSRSGIVDAMSIDKVYTSGNQQAARHSNFSYSWSAAKESAERVFARFNISTATVGRLVLSIKGARLQPPVLRRREVASRAAQGACTGQAAHAANEKEFKETAPPPLVDVVVLPQPKPGAASHTNEERAAIAAALRHRLALHQPLTSSVLLLESNVSLDRNGQIRALPQSSLGGWLEPNEAEAHNVTSLVLPALVLRTWTEQLWQGARVEMISQTHVVAEQVGEVLLWLERNRPDHICFLSALSEVLDPMALERPHGNHAHVHARASPQNHSHLHQTRRSEHSAQTDLADKNSTPRRTLQASSHHSLDFRQAVHRWLQEGRAGCAVPRLQGLRYGKRRCPLPMRSVQGYSQEWPGEHTYGWARTVSNATAACKAPSLSISF